MFKDVAQAPEVDKPQTGSGTDLAVHTCVNSQQKQWEGIDISHLPSATTTIRAEEGIIRRNLDPSA